MVKIFITWLPSTMQVTLWDWMHVHIHTRMHTNTWSWSVMAIPACLEVSPNAMDDKTVHYTLDCRYLYTVIVYTCYHEEISLFGVSWILWDYVWWGNLSSMNCMKSFSYACSICIIRLWWPWNNEKGIHDTCILFSSCVQGASLDELLRCRPLKGFQGSN